MIKKRAFLVAAVSIFILSTLGCAPAKAKISINSPSKVGSYPLESNRAMTRS